MSLYLNTVMILLARFGDCRMNLDQLEQWMRIDRRTLLSKIRNGQMPFPVYPEGRDYYADVNDVAKYHDEQINAVRRIAGSVRAMEKAT